MLDKSKSWKKSKIKQCVLTTINIIDYN